VETLTLDQLMGLTRAADLATSEADRAAKEVGQAERRAARKAQERDKAVAALAAAKAQFERAMAPKK
jgi:hypothetical protein